MKSEAGSNLVWSSGKMPTTIPALAVTYCTEGHWHSDEFDCVEFMDAAPKDDFVIVSVSALKAAGITIDK